MFKLCQNVYFSYRKCTKLSPGSHYENNTLVMSDNPFLRDQPMMEKASMGDDDNGHDKLNHHNRTLDSNSCSGEDS